VNAAQQSLVGDAAERFGLPLRDVRRVLRWCAELPVDVRADLFRGLVREPSSVERARIPGPWETPV
jgi:hypothetical protein